MRFILLREHIRKPLFLLLVLLYIVVCAFLGIFLKAEMTGFYLLYVVSRYMFYLNAAFMLLTFLSCSASYAADIDETISAYKGKGFYQTNIVRYFLLANGLFQITILAALGIASYRNDGTDYFFTYFPKSYAFNILIPLIFCILAAYFLSRWKKTQLAAIAMVVLILLLSPACQLLIWRNEPAFPFDQIWEGALHPFRIFYENGSWAPNTQLGLQTASGRAWLLLFWAGILSMIFAVTLLRKCLRKILTFGIGVLSVIALILSYFPDGQYQINESWDGYLADYDTYENQDAGISRDQVSYRIDNYNLNLYFGSAMQVAGRLHISADNAQSKFFFTLYHGYTVTDLTSQGGDIQWNQDQDIIFVSTSVPVTEMDLEISYEGNHQIFYSYDEGAMLPGWFPWYPMSGEKQVLLNYETVPSGYNTYNRIEPATITLNIEGGDFTLVSNLNQQENGTLHGVSDSITLIGGELVLTNEEQVKDYLPLELGEDEGEFLVSVRQQWAEICRSIEAFGVHIPISKDCSIILTSRDMCRHYYNNDVALFSDYLLTWSEGLTVSTVSQQIILGINSDSSLANLVCSMGGLADTPQETLQNWLNILPAFEDEPLSAYELAPLLQQALTGAERSGMGEDAVIAIAEFLCNGDTNGTDQTFLERLCEKYVDD